MSFVASDIATIPRHGFAWYVIFLQDDFMGPLEEVLSRNFLELGDAVGRDVLAVRGKSSQTFYESAYEAFTLNAKEWQLEPPSLVISDTAPALLFSEKGKLEAAKLVFFPLRSFRDRPAELVELLRDIVGAVKDGGAIDALAQRAPTDLQRAWSFLDRYVEMKPGFFGFSVDVKAALGALLKG